MQNEANSFAERPPASKAMWVLAAAPTIFTVAAFLLVGVGYLWSQFFDTAGHVLAALALIPAALTAWIFSIFILMGLRNTGRCERLAFAGVWLTLLALI